MNDNAPNNNDGKDQPPECEYSHAQVLVNNLPYMTMIVLGTAILFVSLENSVWKWISAVSYLAYGLAGAFWIIFFVCPYCSFWNTRSCPCGYGLIAAKLREKKTTDNFGKKFKKHIPVIVPLWFIPIMAGLYPLIRTFSWPLLILLIVFALDAFVVLPLFSTKHGCKNCPQRDLCPWMMHKVKLAAAPADCEQSL